MYIYLRKLSLNRPAPFYVHMYWLLCFLCCIYSHWLSNWNLAEKTRPLWYNSRTYFHGKMGDKYWWKPLVSVYSLVLVPAFRSFWMALQHSCTQFLYKVCHSVTATCIGVGCELTRGSWMFSTKVLLGNKRWEVAFSLSTRLLLHAKSLMGFAGTEPAAGFRLFNSIDIL